MNRLAQALVALVAVLPVILSAAAAPTAGSVQIQFTTKSTGQKYSPRHVLAVWVTDAKGGFVKTLMLRAERQRRRLVVWQQSSPNNTVGLTDAITGATARTHETVRLEWDCRDAAGNLVPDGSYFIRVEFTEQNSPGPVTPRGYLPLEKGKLPFSAKPKKLDYFADLRVSFTPQPAAASVAPPPPAPPVAPTR